MTFQPYTFRQLQEIVYSRIKGIDAFEEDAVELIARKVSHFSFFMKDILVQGVPKKLCPVYVASVEELQD